MQGEAQALTLILDSSYSHYFAVTATALLLNFRVQGYSVSPRDATSDFWSQRNHATRAVQKGAVIAAGTEPTNEARGEYQENITEHRTRHVRTPAPRWRTYSCFMAGTVADFHVYTTGGSCASAAAPSAACRLPS